MDAIRQLDTGTSLFFDHRDPAMVKLLGEAKTKYLKSAPQEQRQDEK
jgi:hypothetical protein